MTPARNPGRRILVLGGYGLIGAEVARVLMARGHAVTGLGRDREAARRALPDARWHIRDLRALTSAADWVPLVAGMDMVVNCAGALQEMPGDDLAAVHERAVAALAEACGATGCGIVQISAAGVDEGAGTAFLSTKARGDAAVRASAADWWVLRPGLVLAPSGYGGTGLLRMLAAVPVIQPVAMAGARVQTVAVGDVALAVARAAEGDLAPRQSLDLVEDRASGLGDMLGAIRAWLGFAPARRQIQLPGPLLRLTARAADGLGRLGWRSPLRSTVLAVLADGVRGDPAQTHRALGRPALSLDETLAAMPARAEDRIAARMSLMMPFTVAVLALFWGLSGLVGILSLEEAAAHLAAGGWYIGFAKLAVLFWAGVDIALAGLLLWRRTAKAACMGMVAVSLVYLASATLVTPWMWADPLGPLVKVLPAIMLALVARAMLESR